MGSNFLLVKNLSIASFSDNGPILLMFQWSLIFVSAFKNEPENNTKIILSSLQHLTSVIKEFDSTTPATQITFQVITEGFVTEKEFTDVQLNVKRWQEVTKLSGGSDQLNRILSMLTGSH